MAAAARAAGLPSRVYLTLAGTASANPAAAAAATSVGAPSAPRSATPSTDSHTMAGTSGRSYRLVIVSWNSRWKTRYGSVRSASASTARRERRATATKPAHAASRIGTASDKVAHGSTNV